MAKARKPRRGPPDPRNFIAFESWLSKRPREWSAVIAARAALRVIPLLHAEKFLAGISLSVFRATAIAIFAAKYSSREIGDAASAAHAGTKVISARVHNDNISTAGHATIFTAGHAAFAAYADTADAANAAAYSVDDSASGSTPDALAAAMAVRFDVQRLYDGISTTGQLARDPLWPVGVTDEFTAALQQFPKELSRLGQHWRVWVDWYGSCLLGELATRNSEAEDAAYTDLPGDLPWNAGAEAVNTAIEQRLAELRVSKIPDQSPAPVRVEERDGKVAKATDRDSELSASERDFKAWRDPVVDHIDELTASDFAKGTNHSRVRDRLTALGKLLPGEIAEVKERQFRIGYEIERFDGLMAAYRTGGEDMPVLNAAHLEDLDRLRVALKIGIDKLERWSEFRKQANESTTGEAEADRETVADAMDEMAEVMEQRPRYFHPELPASFRFLAESVRDRSGATKTVVFGAVKSAENVVSFLGQRALGIGKKGVEAVETHISKAVAASLITGLSSAALGLSGALPQGWAWLKPLLAALGVGG